MTLAGAVLMPESRHPGAPPLGAPPRAMPSPRPGWHRAGSGKLCWRVPSVRSLQQEYGGAQGTAERALTILREEGLIVSVQGRGHFVAEQPEP